MSEPRHEFEGGYRCVHCGINGNQAIEYPCRRAPSTPESETERPETNIHPSEGATLPPSHVGGQRQAGRPTDTPDMVGSAAAGGPTPETEDGECTAGFLLRRIADEFAAIPHPDTQEDE